MYSISFSPYSYTNIIFRNRMYFIRKKMLELFEKLLIGHGYQKESINDTIFNMANEIREDAKKLEVMFETDFSNNDTINKIIRKYS